MNHRAEAVQAAAADTDGEISEPTPQPPAHARPQRYGYAPHVGPAALEEAMYWTREATEAAHQAQVLGPSDDMGSPEELRIEALWLNRARAYAAAAVANSALARACATGAIIATMTQATEDEAADWDGATGRRQA